MIKNKINNETGITTAIVRGCKSKTGSDTKSPQIIKAQETLFRLYAVAHPAKMGLGDVEILTRSNPEIWSTISFRIFNPEKINATAMIAKKSETGSETPI